MALAFSFDLVAGSAYCLNEAGLEVRIDTIALENVFQTYDEMGISFDEQGLQDVIAGLLPSLLGSGDPIIIELNEEALLAYPWYLKSCLPPTRYDEPSSSACFSSSVPTLPPTKRSVRLPS